MASAVWRLLLSSSASPENRDQVLRILSEDRYFPPVEENLLLRLIVASFRGILTIDEVRASLRCRHFRVNVASVEIHQIVAISQLTRDWFGISSPASFAFVKQELREQPYNEIEDADEFEIRSDPPEFEDFELFLQSPAGTPAVPLVMVLRADGTYDLTIDRGSNIRVPEDPPKQDQG